jgi:hypothetical protein
VAGTFARKVEDSNDDRSRGVPMFQFNDAGFQLDQYHQRSTELRRDAEAHRLARQASGGGRQASGGGRHRQAWRSRFARRPRQVQAPAPS